MLKTQRIRDAVHNLIVFREGNDTDQLAWGLLNTREFQRLRRIRQLGFSEFVYPGATHTRFSHCVGVFHTARQLLGIIKQKLGDKYDRERADVVLCAALLHDIGHGPFSHAFENAEKSRGQTKDHERWSSEIILGDTEVHKILVEFKDEKFAEDAAALLTAKEPADIYASVISSQFDADRLDYIRRDRYMTGTGTSHIDFEWLLDCLEVGKITFGDNEKDDFREVDGLYLNYKGLHAAESYILGRYYLYSQVYMHKTTRGAEKLLSEFLLKLSAAIKEKTLPGTNIPEDHPLVVYLGSKPCLKNYLEIDDNEIWSALNQARRGSNESLSKLGMALTERKLFKCFDPTLIPKRGDMGIPRFRRALQERSNELGLTDNETLLFDDFTLSAYMSYSFEDGEALQNVLIGHRDGTDLEDLDTRSEIIKSIGKKKVYRVYAPGEETIGKVIKLWREENP